MRSVAQITRSIRESQNLSLEAFGVALAEEFDDRSFTRQAVHGWEAERTIPDFQFLILASFKYNDWRRVWALDCLAALKPDVFAPATPAPLAQSFPVPTNAPTPPTA
jgi:hypothetical protein